MDTGVAAAAAAAAAALRVVYATVGGTARSLAESLAAAAGDTCAVCVSCASSWAAAPFESGTAAAAPVYAFIVSTAGDGEAPPSAQPLLEWLHRRAAEAEGEAAGKPLAGMRYCVFALGDSAYPRAKFALAGRRLDQLLHELGAERAYKMGVGDASGDVPSVFAQWARMVCKQLRRPLTGQAAVDDDEAEDVEDSVSSDGGVDRPMVLPGGRQRADLEAQGYHIIGSHSAAKQCRWTRNALRGRGFCYKYTFYGIRSHQCLEMTPSLACANKCVFCWRHHKNPVATQWKWLVDDPRQLVEEGIKAHQEMVRPLKGVPGVSAERYEEAFTVRHCALSLVGEPIMYPRINEFMSELHHRGVTSFLVTNAQLPSAIASLCPVTQLYASADAGNADTLKRVDRPLFEDSWQRFEACLDELAKKRQRTVLRVTLVKDWNFDPPSQYAALARRGKPHFIEIKGATYCGGEGNVLTMRNIPWHDEVLQFAKDMEVELSDEYAIASEHIHSCCVLLARKSLYHDGQWHTWIDQEKFMQLVNADGSPDFSAEDYSVPMPEWAQFGSSTRGVAPSEQKVPHK
eukprot:TRINITY_DN155_c1_g1_i1.p1 TRINITY_DN155_c1_g1~~TRINITY_DN155_c1_g1_i1.p1  ORF type:complete len:579 (-),score=139.57 TRINITY_DN155_c1_g1_i1:70-1785(-)